jgi:hypothetical protein
MRRKRRRSSSHRRSRRRYPTGGESGALTGRAADDYLFKPGNVGLARLLLALAKAGSDGGMATRRLLETLHSTHHAQAAIKRAEKMGLIERVEQPPECKGNRLKVNKLTPMGQQLLDKLVGGENKNK